jgi:hypothetical protein
MVYDHDGQLLSLHQQELHCKSVNPNHKTIRIFNKFSLDEFKFRLSYEIWENVLNTEDSDIDNIFNTFANTYLQIFYACFLKKKIYEQSPPKQWLTNGIKTSCKRKKELYLLTKANDNNELQQYYKLYSKILVIR